MLKYFEPVLASLAAGLPTFALHFGGTLAILVVGVLVYMAVTPIHEGRLIKAGNTAAAISFGSAVLGLAIPLAFCLKSSVSLPDILVWGAVSLVLQLAAYFAASTVFRDLARRIEAGEVSAAIALGATNLAVATLNAAAVSG